MKIRRAEIKDKEAIWKVHTNAIRNVCCSHYNEQQVETWAGKINPDSYLRSIQEKEMFVAEFEDEIVGFCQLDLDRNEIEAVYIDSTKTNMGVGKQLLKKLETTAKDNGIKKLTLLSSLNAVNFYNRQGFIAKSETFHRISNDTELSCVEMEKVI